MLFTALNVCARCVCVRVCVCACVCVSVLIIMYSCMVPYHESSNVESIKVSKDSLQQRCAIRLEIEVEIIKRHVHGIDGPVAK